MPWHLVARITDFGENDVIGRECAGRALALYRLGEEYFATQGVCTHANAPLAAGEVVDGYIECPAHFGLFDIRTGEAAGAPVTRRLKTYPVRVAGGNIEVEIDT